MQSLSMATTSRDKRHAIEMLIVKEDLRTHNIQIRCVATFQMLGDILTKRGVSVDLLLKVLNWGMFTIIEDKSIRPKNQQGVRENYFGVCDFFCRLPLHLVVKDQSDGLCAIGVQRSPLDAGCHSCSPLDGKSACWCCLGFLGCHLGFHICINTHTHIYIWYHPPNLPF